jgi:hypothetical protein
MKSKRTILDTAKKVECLGCEKGVAMCNLRPCWGTVEDFKKIIEAGYAKKLMIDYYNADAINNGEKIYFLCGASHNNECSKADWNPKGTCLLLEDDKCTINDIKPTMGRIMCCKKNISGKKYINACMRTWTTQEGSDLIEKWKKMVNYVDKDDNEGFSFVDAFNAMIFGF